MKTPPIYPIEYYYRHKLPLYERGKGRYKVGDIVEWGRYSGAVVEVVMYGRYPHASRKIRLQGYWREMETYVVMDVFGKCHWPKVGSIKPVRSK